MRQLRSVMPQLLPLFQSSSSLLFPLQTTPQHKHNVNTELYQTEERERLLNLKLVQFLRLKYHAVVLQCSSGGAQDYTV